MIIFLLKNCVLYFTFASISSDLSWFMTLKALNYGDFITKFKKYITHNDIERYKNLSTKNEIEIA